MNWLKDRSMFLGASMILGSLMFLFLVLPILSTVLNPAFQPVNAVTDRRTVDAILTSFLCAFLATAFSFVSGVPFAYLVTRREFVGKRVIDSLIDLPILIPHNAAGIALLLLYGPRSALGSLLENIGLSFIDTIPGIVIAMAFVSAPFMIKSAEEAFTSINPEIEQVAMSLGATQFQVFRNVTFPLALRGILTGCVLTWTRAVSEFGAVVILAYYPKTAPIHLFDIFVSEGLQAALPITSLLILLALLLLFAFRTFAPKPIPSSR
jgi:molybdate/tungstate transport system permease protein